MLLRYNWRVGIFCDGPLILRHMELLFGFDTGFLGLTQKRMPKVNRVLQDPLNCCIVPKIRSPGSPIFREVALIKHLILQWRNDAIIVQIHCDLPTRVASCGTIEYSLNNRSGFLIRDQSVLVSGILRIAIRRSCTVQPLLTLSFQDLFHFS